MLPVTEAREPSPWLGIRESVAGPEPDFTTGDLDRAILLLTIPMVLPMAAGMESRGVLAALMICESLIAEAGQLGFRRGRSNACQV